MRFITNNFGHVWEGDRARGRAVGWVSVQGGPGSLYGEVQLVLIRSARNNRIWCKRDPLYFNNEK